MPYMKVISSKYDYKIKQLYNFSKYIKNLDPYKASI